MKFLFCCLMIMFCEKVNMYPRCTVAHGIFSVTCADRKQQRRRRRTLVFTFRTFESLASRWTCRVQAAAVVHHSRLSRKKSCAILLPLQTFTRPLLVALHRLYLAAQISRRPLRACWSVAQERGVLKFSIFTIMITVDNRTITVYYIL